MADTVVLKKEDVVFMQNQFNLLVDKVKELEEELEIYKSEYEPRDIKDLINFEEVNEILKKDIISEEDEEHANDSDFEQN